MDINQCHDAIHFCSGLNKFPNNINLGIFMAKNFIFYQVYERWPSKIVSRLVASGEKSYLYDKISRGE
jgi:hypothetical protein